MKEMTILLVFLGLLACSRGQLIYPDQFEQYLKTSTLPSYLYPSVGRQNQQNTPSLANNPVSSPPKAFFQNNVPFFSTPRTTTTGQPFAYNSAAAENPLQDWNDHVNNIIVKGTLKFALDMERQIYKTQNTAMIDQRDNIVFSPISLAVTLAIVLAGSAGRTFDEVTRVLGLEAGVDISKNSEIVHQMFGILLDQLHHKMEGSPQQQLDFATAAFVQDGYPIRPQFKTLSNNVYNNEVINVDFVKNGKLTVEMINAWVKQKTMGKITNILNDVPDPATTIILLSALYFNGEWNQYFLNNATKKSPFYIETNKSVEVDLMYNGGTFPFYEDKQLGVKILGLPYKGHQTTMYVLLPTARGAKALRNFQEQLTPAIVENLINNMKNETCIAILPRMKLSSNFNLATTLANIGLPSLFNPATSDLSLISQGYNLSDPTRTQKLPFDMQRPDFSSRIDGEKNASHVVRRNYFTYEDKKRGLTVEQWSTGFSIKKRRSRRDSTNRQPLRAANRNSYAVDGSAASEDEAKVVNLEGNKYRFQNEARRAKTKRQTRPIDQDFLNFVRQRNFPSYGLDDLRNSMNLVNPHLYASQVLHKVEIEVTETGTEAAAVTGTALDRNGSQKRVVANRPFIFFIRHEPTKLVLFWATVNAPTPNYPVVT